MQQATFNKKKLTFAMSYNYKVFFTYKYDRYYNIPLTYII